MSALQDPQVLPSDSPAYPRRLRASLTLAILVVAFVASYVDRHLFALLITPIKAALHVGDFKLSLLAGAAFSIFYSVFGVPIGMLADRFSRKYLIIVGMILWSLATMASGLATGFAMLFVFRMAVGVGEAVLAPSSYSMLGDLFPPHLLVRATSILSLAATLSAGLALIIGGQVIGLATHAHALPFGMMSLAPWQRTFILVGLPGFPIALLIFLSIREPLRLGPAGQIQDPSHDATPQSLQYLWRHRRVYVPIYLTAAGLAAMVSGGLTWFPTYLIRAFALTPSRAGLIVGSVQAIGSILGTLLGVTMSEAFMRRGYRDGPLRTVSLTSFATAAMVVVFFVPSLSLTVALWLVGVIFQSTYYGNLSAALQSATPSRARATNIAILYLTINVIGVAGGGALIGVISQHVFPGDPRGVGYGIAIVGGCGALIACATSALGMKPYREMVDLRPLDGAARQPVRT